MTIILKPEQERVLIEAINSGLAHTPAEALDQALESLRRRLPEPRTANGETNADKAQAFEQWARNHPKRPPLPETAFQRESMIRDAG
jgi:hypothetical protein